MNIFIDPKSARKARRLLRWRIPLIVALLINGALVVRGAFVPNKGLLAIAKSTNESESAARTIKQNASQSQAELKAGSLETPRDSAEEQVALTTPLPRYAKPTKRSAGLPAARNSAETVDKTAAALPQQDDHRFAVEATKAHLANDGHQRADPLEKENTARAKTNRLHRSVDRVARVEHVNPTPLAASAQSDTASQWLRETADAAMSELGGLLVEYTGWTTKTPRLLARGHVEIVDRLKPVERKQPDLATSRQAKDALTDSAGQLQKPQPQPASSYLTLTIPERTQGRIQYLVNGTLYSLQAGQSHRLGERVQGAGSVTAGQSKTPSDKPVGDQSYVVRFHRGGRFGEASFQLRSGTYVFLPTKRGWDLIEEDSLPTKKSP